MFILIVVMILVVKFCMFCVKIWQIVSMIFVLDDSNIDYYGLFLFLQPF